MGAGSVVRGRAGPAGAPGRPVAHGLGCRTCTGPTARPGPARLPGAQLQAGALLLVLTYRSDELHRRHPLQPLLAGLDRSGRAERLEVDRFERADLADLLAGILGAPPDAGLLERISRRGQRLLRRGAGGRRAARRRTRPAAPPGERGVDPHPGPSRRDPSGAAVVARCPAPSSTGCWRRSPNCPRQSCSPRCAPPSPTRSSSRSGQRDLHLPARADRGSAVRRAAARRACPAARRLRPRDQRAPGPGRVQPAATSSLLAYHWVKAHSVRALPAAIQAGLQAQAAYAFADAQEHFETALELWDQVPTPSSMLSSAAPGCCGTPPSRRTRPATRSGRSR